MCYSPWGCKESDMTEHTHVHSLHHVSLSVNINLCMLTNFLECPSKGKAASLRAKIVFHPCIRRD